jgi:recombinational DNA repair protein (RecF pathway)
MSVDRCVDCDRQVDTDDDVDCYIEDECVCESCREKGAREAAEDQRLDDPRHGQAAALNRGRY